MRTGLFCFSVWSSNVFWPSVQEKHKKLTDQFSDQNVFSVEDPWETRKCHIYAFLKRLFLHVLFSLVFYLYTCNIKNKKKRLQMSLWLVLWMQMLWFYLSGMIVKMKKWALNYSRSLVSSFHQCHGRFSWDFPKNCLRLLSFSPLKTQN